MRLTILVTSIVLAAPAIAQEVHGTRGYVKSDGTYVAPHYRPIPTQHGLTTIQRRATSIPTPVMPEQLILMQ